MNNYAVDIRRKLHMFPEVGFELPKTLELLRSELDSMGVEYTEKYGKSSIVATVNPEKNHFTIGIRADIDALPILEANDVPYKSQIEGQMHACGHDAHTAIALATLREIYTMRDKVDCCVKFIFQSAEEVSPSGAKLMAEDGVMDDIDCIAALHVDTAYEAGTIGLSVGDQNAISDGFLIEFFGKSAHAVDQKCGRDAIMMAVKAYMEIELMIAKDFNGDVPVIFNVGSMHGGDANNIICDYAYMYCSLRTHDDEVAEYALNKIKKIINAIAETSDGRAEYTHKKHYPKVTNNPVVTERIRKAAETVIGKENILPKRRGMGGEDFSYFARQKPGCMFRLGVVNKERGIVHPVHTVKFDVDESALELGVNIFKQFILDNMHGIDFSCEINNECEDKAASIQSSI